MKQIFFRSVFALFISCVFSCSDLLSDDNPTAITGVYDTEAMLESNVVGVTSNGFTTAAVYEIFGGASGIVTWGVTGEAQYEQTKFTHCMNFSIQLSGSENKNFFYNQYSVIQKANLILANLSDSPVDADYKKEIEAECKFYRAMAYFNLVRCYGDVPLRLTPPSAKDATYCPVSPYYEVYAQIIKDFQSAADDMRSPQRVEEISPKNFRPNRFITCRYT